MTRDLPIQATLVLKNLLGRPVRTALTVIGIATASCVFILLLHVIGGYRDGWVKMFTTRGIDLFLLEKGKLDPLTSRLDPAIVARLRELPTVRSCAGSLTDALSLGDRAHILVVGHERDSPVWNELAFVEGRRPGGKGDAAVGRSVLQTTGRKVGDRIELGFQAFTISGVFEPRNLFEANSVFVDIDELRRLRGVGRIYSSIEVRLRRGGGHAADARDVEAVLAREFPSAKVNVTADFFANDRLFRSLERLVAIISVLAFGLVAMSCMNTLGTAVLERTGQIGMLRTVGWSRGAVALAVLGESVLLSFAGWAVGAALASLAAALMDSRDLFLFGGRAVPAARLLIESAALCLLGGGVGALPPMLKAVRMDPADAFSLS